MWTRVFDFCDINFEDYTQLISDKEIIFKNDHPFAVLNNDLVSLGTILESIFKNNSLEIKNKLKKIYSIKISDLSIQIKKNIENYQIEEYILDSILLELLKPIQDISDLGFLDKHKSSYYQIMQTICNSKKVNKIFIYDEKLFDDYSIRTNYDIGCQTLIILPKEKKSSKKYMPSILNLPSFLQSRNTIFLN